jgi:hypothetical protein
MPQPTTPPRTPLTSVYPPLTSALDVTSDQLCAPVDLPPGKATNGTYSIEGSVDPTTGLDDLEDIFPPAWN